MRTTSLEWTLLFNVLFGSIASRAFSEFYQSMIADWDEDLDLHETTHGAARQAPAVKRYYLLRILIFASAFSFYVYDWIVVQLLFAKYPYTVTSVCSYFRFANDLVMAFGLFGIVSNAAHRRVLQRPLRMVCFISVWHMLAASWHVLAELEYGAAIEFDFPLRWHLVYVQFLYWATYLTFRFVILPWRATTLGYSEAARRTSLWIIGTESVIVLGISFARTFLVLYATSYLH
ncbi:MAG TPA: hypothetical protein VFI31_08145 [Pirellulales bacterium]|nr:hypothetical protein [Pirellulales bacterium]